MMSPLDDAALDRHLGRLLAANRRLRDPDRTPGNAEPMLARLQRWQAQRLRASFTDFLADPQMRPAAEFFLSDLYGDHDVTARDRAVERVMPLMRRILPGPLLMAAADAIELAALSHAFDLRMAGVLSRDGRNGEVDAERYAAAYRKVGKPRLRARQIDLIMDVGKILDRAVRKPWVWRLLRVSRLPAKAAGLSDLQQFLERGFSAFRELGGAKRFLSEIGAREREVSRRLFAGEDDPFLSRAPGPDSGGSRSRSGP
jgi:hypothetical protein